MEKEARARCSRRQMLAGSAMFLGGGVAACATGAGAAEPASAPEAPPLPWEWTAIEPMEAGTRAYRFYKQKGGCGTGSYLSLLSLLKEKVGYPWTTLPDFMMAHAGAGYAGHGTLCGSLGGAASIINLVAWGPEKGAIYQQMIDRLFWWYAKQEFPTDRFDDISPMPGQIKVAAKSPLCHTSVSSWTLAAGEEVTSEAKIERCAKVCGEVVYTVVKALNEYFEGRWEPPIWEPSEEVLYCIDCHGPDGRWHEGGGLNQQQGHMECMLCHEDHTED